MNKLKFLCPIIIGAVMFTSCEEKEDNLIQNQDQNEVVVKSARSTMCEAPLSEGVGITLRNTLQDPGEAEATYASLFGQADNAFDEFAKLSNEESEFPTALSQSPATGAPFDISGLYDIDFTEYSISFSVLPDETDPFWSGVFGLFPEGKFDRYYFTFSEPHNVKDFKSDNEFLNVRIDSDKVLVVELMAGYVCEPGVSFGVRLIK